MDVIKVLFVGLGSIAKRHIKNLNEIFHENQKKLCIDVFRTTKNSKINQDIEPLVQKMYYEVQEVPNDYDIIFITNPTIVHIDTLKTFHEKGQHFFIEKPLCTMDQLENLEMNFMRKDSVYYVASPLRYTKVLKYIKENIDVNKVYAVRSISSSYLPEWRNEIDYRNTYSAQKKLGGGVSIDLIHEWDYLTYLFGKPEKVIAILKKVSNLEIDSEDIAIYIGEYTDKTVEIHLDYFGRKNIRQMELFMEDDTVICDLINSTICFQKNKKVIEFKEERDNYQIEELKYFLGLIKNRCYSHEKLLEACEILKLTGGKR